LNRHEVLVQLAAKSVTGEVFQSDIEFARRALSEGQSDEAIISALVKRRIDSGKAAQLLDDLRAGRSVSAAKPVVPRVRRTEQPGTSGEPRRGLPKVKPPGKREDKYNRLAKIVIILTFVAGLVAVVALNLRKQRAADTGGMFEASPGAVTNATAPATNAAAAK
jgi:hypothetical protein